MMTRNDLSRPRARFRLREDGTLETKECPACSGPLYVVPAGTWLHWGTLAEECKASEGSQTNEKVPFGPAMVDRGPYPLDSPERGLTRAGLSSTYRRGSWEWMGCR